MPTASTIIAALKALACLASGVEKSAICAGFLISQGAHNMGVRMAVMSGALELGRLRSPVELYPSYRAMAIANGVDPDDPVLRRCRDDAQIGGAA